MGEHIKDMKVYVRLPYMRKPEELKIRNLEVKIVWDDNLFSEVSIESLVKENAELKHMRDGVTAENEMLNNRLQTLAKVIEGKAKIIDYQTSKIKKLENEGAHWKVVAESFKGLYELECGK